MYYILWPFWAVFRLLFLPFELVRFVCLCLHRFLEFLRTSNFAKFIYGGGIIGLGTPTYAPPYFSHATVELTAALFSPWVFCGAVIIVMFRAVGNPVPVPRPFWRIAKPAKRVKQKPQKTTSVALANCKGIFPSIPTRSMGNHLSPVVLQVIASGENNFVKPES